MRSVEGVEGVLTMHDYWNLVARWSIKVNGFALRGGPDRRRVEDRWVNGSEDWARAGKLRLLEFLAFVISRPALWPTVGPQWQRHLGAEPDHVLLVATVFQQSQEVLAAARHDKVVKAEFHTECYEFVIEVCLLPDILRSERVGQAQWLVRKANRCRAIVTQKKLLQQLSGKDDEMVVNAEERFAELVDDLAVVWKKLET